MKSTHVSIPFQTLKMQWSLLKKATLLPFQFFLVVVTLSFFTACKKSINDEQSSLAEYSQATQLNVNRKIGINVVLNTSISISILSELRNFGQTGKIFNQIKALTMLVDADKLPLIKALPYVSNASGDGECSVSPVNLIAVNNVSAGIGTWNLDAINVTEHGAGRTVDQDGTGVYVGVLDTGLPKDWRQYFSQDRIATQYAKSFGGGGADLGIIAEQPNKWEHDQHTHGAHVTSTIIGYNFGTTAVTGVAPGAKIIPVKVLNQNGSGWWSVIAQGVLYIAGLKVGALANSPVVISMSLGGVPESAMLKAAIDYAISKGVIVVAAAGNSGNQGMGFPGSYAPVISVAAAGWVSQFSTPAWWYNLNVPDPTNENDFFVPDFSSRSISLEQDLDVTAPGVSVVGPFQYNSGHLTYYFLSGTSMATPHVAGIVALMAQKKPSLTALEAETKLQSAAITMSAGPSASGHGFITADAALNGL